MPTRYFLFAILAIATCLISSSLGFANEDKTPSEARLLERAKTYWDALKVRDFNTMYEMEAAAREGLMSADNLRRSVGRSRLTGYDFKGVKIEGDVAVIQVERQFRMEGIAATGIPSEISDPWMYRDGEWFHAQGMRLRSQPPIYPEKTTKTPEEESASGNSEKSKNSEK